MSQTASVVSAGRIAVLCQVLPVRVRNAAAALGISPSLVINDVQHFAQEDVQQIIDFLRDQKPRTQESWNQSL